MVELHFKCLTIAIELIRSQEVQSFLHYHRGCVLDILGLWGCSGSRDTDESGGLMRRGFRGGGSLLLRGGSSVLLRGGRSWSGKGLLASPTGRHSKTHLSTPRALRIPVRVLLAALN